MLFKTIKKDLKRKKTMNFILLLFIILATVFVASGINNVVNVVNGTDYYLDKAEIGDFLFILQGEDVIGSLDDTLNDCKEIDSYKLEDVIFASQDNYRINGKKVDSKNAGILQGFDGKGIKFFNLDNEEIKDVPKGHVYISGSFMKRNGVKIGDKMRITHGSVDKELIVVGKIKDAFLGSDLMGNTRFLMNQEDMKEFFEDENLYHHYGGQLGYIFTKDTDAVAQALASAKSVAFAKPRSMIEMCYVLDMIVAFMVLIMSICLMIVAFMVLKFSISFTIMEEYREIGVMKAIGIKNFQIRSLYIGKYFVMAIIGSAIGFGLSIPFGKELLKSVSDNMVLGNDGGVVINIIGAILVVVMITWFAFLCTKKVKKATPIDAIRSGQTGERYKKKTIYRIGRSRLNTSGYMALNDVLSSPKRFLSIIISFSICTMLVLMIVNTAETMKSSNLIHLFLSESDAYVVDTKAAMKNMSMTKEEVLEDFHSWEDKLEEKGIPCYISYEFMYKYKVTFDGKDYSPGIMQGLNNKSTDYVYMKGEAPLSENEIAIASGFSKNTKADIGDTLEIDFGDRKVKCIVTGIFQTMNQMGDAIRLWENTKTDRAHSASAFAYQINYTDNPSKEERAKRMEIIKAVFDNDEVYDAAGYCAMSVEAVDTMDAVSILLLAITLVVVILVTVLMERSFIADEKSQIAMLKAIGFSEGAIIKWQVYRFAIIALVAEILAAILSIPATELVSTPIFQMMGASSIKYEYNLLKIFVLYPLIIVAVTVVVAWLTALYSKKISSADTANIE